MKKINYYSVLDDLLDYPDAWCYVAISKRGPGKTYGCLKGALDQKKRIVYMKRTMDDVDLICSQGSDTDCSPYKPINRDTGHNIKPSLIRSGIGAFYETDPEDKPLGPPVAYTMALSAVRKYKGFDLSDADWIVFDEFVPQVGESRINRKEGDQLLDFYMTVSRDREQRGRDPLKLIMFANTVNVSSPVTNVLEITDDLAGMANKGIEYNYLPDRGILLHWLPPDKYVQADPEKNSIYKAMQNTAWGRMAFSGDFAYNDFTAVKTMSLKGCKPMIHLHYKTHDYYIYLRQSDGLYYMCRSRSDRCLFSYDLNRENGQKLFYLEHQIDLRNETINDKMIFEQYSMYDLIINYKQFFSL